MTTVDTPLSGEQYIAAMDLLSTAAALVEDMPLIELRNMIERAETLGPLLEPTAYMRGGADNLRDQRELLDAALGLAAVVQRIRLRHS